MIDYEERKQARIDRLNDRADSKQVEATDRRTTADNMISVLPPGQPILVGHHSERSHRRLLEKANNNMRKAVDLDNQARELRRRAEAAEKNTAISSDDPEALVKLKEKLQGLEDLQAQYKAVNKIIKKKKFTDEDKVKALVKDLHFSEDNAREALTPDCMGQIGIPSCTLTNNNAKIRSTKKRIAKLEAQVSTPAKAPVTIGDVEIIDDKEENRIMIFFSGKPDEETRTKLKRNGFKWSRRNEAWQAYRKEWNWQAAITIAESINN